MDLHKPSTEARIRNLMRTLLEGMRPSWVGEQLGVSRQTVDAWRRGYNVSGDRLEQVARLRLEPFLWEDADGPVTDLSQVAGLESTMLRQLLEGLDARGELKPALGTAQLEEKIDAIITRDEVLELVDDAKRAIVSEVQLNREALYTAIAEELVSKALPRLLEELRAERSNGTQDPPPETAGQPPRPRA